MGGIGNLQGAVLGGLIIGCIQQISDNRIGTEWTPAIVFAFLDPDHGLPAAGPARRGDEGGRMSTAVATLPTARAASRVPPWAARGLAVVLGAAGDPAAVLLRPDLRLHRRLRRSRWPTSSWRSASTSSSASPACSTSGYVAFFAIGAYTVGWFVSGFFVDANIHMLVSGHACNNLPGHPRQLHLHPDRRGARCARSPASLIGLPTLRLRGDYIAIVTLAFGEIIRVFAVNGDDDQDRQRRAR